MRERALRELGLAPGWVRRHAAASGAASGPAATADAAVELLDVSALDLAALHAAIEQCEACPRAARRSRAVPGEGPGSVRLIVIDHVPSRADAANGALRDTDGARLFDQLLFALGLKRDAVYLTHALRCDGAVPTSSEATCCAPYLKREIELLAPRALLALGAAASDAIRAHQAADGPRVFAIEHPVALLSDVSGKRRAWSILRELRSHLFAG